MMHIYAEDNQTTKDEYNKSSYLLSHRQKKPIKITTAASYSQSNKVPQNIIHIENYISVENIKDRFKLELKNNITKQNKELQI